MIVGWYPEQLVAERLQLTHGALEAYRRSLKKNDDWKKDGREILLSPDAVKRLLAELGSPDYDISSCAIAENGEKQKPASVELTIEKIFPNPRLIQARTEAGELVRVRVPSSVNFQPRMKIKAHPPLNEQGPQLYRLEGRVPRFRGRW